MSLQTRDRLPLYGKIPGIPAYDSQPEEGYAAMRNHGMISRGAHRKSASVIPIVRGKRYACS